MTIEWRTTAGGVEIAEHEDMTFVVYRSGYAEVFREGNRVHQKMFYGTPAEAKEWCENEHCQPKYTVTKYGDGGEVYASNDGTRVAMLSVIAGVWSLDKGDGKCTTFFSEHRTAELAAIAYVTGKDPQ